MILSPSALTFCSLGDLLRDFGLFLHWISLPHAALDTDQFPKVY